ncbi:hypothetical protein K9O30_06075 [Clostridium bowmanii]|uniref:hypothetical protein n=1 Tax=Clostridium bowmanii TaxID=132925 RepID=UPI001C0E10A0|nr:hypothetical protein [Clostridium bowmanii]MBU3188727.1 hypothetical protein [Clostridium bowmanii]MCA1073312.1 hypothetical protein [Clostridium bowmanii]
MSLLDPSTVHGALLIGIMGGLISGVIIGFFSGRTYEKKVIKKSKNKTKGNKNIVIQNSNLKGN